MPTRAFLGRCRARLLTKREDWVSLELNPGLLARGNRMRGVEEFRQRRILRLGEAAALAGVCTRTIRRWVAKGLLHPVEITAYGERRYDRDKVIALTRTQERRKHNRKQSTAYRDMTRMWDAHL